MEKPYPVTIEVDWIIEPPTKTFDLLALSASNPANDEWRQSDTLGPEPATPATGPPETDGGGSQAMSAK